ncbi:hypothetical protein Tco_0984448 [Tanacetum coccineum]
MSPPIRRKYHDSVAFATGCKKIKNSKRGNRKIRIPIAMWPCRVEEKMTLKEVDGQTVEEIETKIIAKDGTITRVPGKFLTRTLSPPQVVNLCGRRQLKLIMTARLVTAHIVLSGLASMITWIIVDALHKMAPSRRSGSNNDNNDDNNNNENPDIAAIIAQQLQTILPQIVTQVTNNVNNANNGNGGNGGGGC